MFADGNEKLYDFNKRSDEAGLLCTDPSLTVQADAVDADINVIVERYGLTGKLPDNFRLPTYQDYDEVFDFATAQRAMMDGATEFMKIPAPIRALFENDPGHFYQFAIDPDNFDKLVEMGLAKKAEPIQTAEAAIPSTPGAAPAVAPPATPAAPATPTT